MSGAAKKIIDGLGAANVSASDQARTKPMIDEAHDWDAAQAAIIESIVRYVCGVGEQPQLLEPYLLENNAEKLLRGLSTGRTLDGWDTRALDVIALAKATLWFWKLDRWMCDRVAASPADPIFEEALELFRARGLWADDSAVISSMVMYMNVHVTTDGALTSTGRWLLAKIDHDAESVFAIARAQKPDRTSSLYALLLAHRRDLFDALMPTLALKKDSDRSFLAEKLLEADAQRYETQVVALLASIKDGYPALLAAMNLEKYFPGTYRAEVKRLLRATVKAGHNTIHFQDRAADARMVALEVAWRALGEEAIELWGSYKEQNDEIRMRFYAMIEEQAKEKAVPLLIDGLVHPKDPTIDYGGLTHAKYVQRVLALLKPYDLTPHRDRIAAAFGKKTNKKVRELIDVALGIETTGKAAAAKRVTPFAAAHGYRFETYVAAVIKAALVEAKKNKQRMPSPIEQVKLGGMQGDIQLNTLILEGVGEPVELELRVPKGRVPTHVDMTDDDKVLRKFGKLHGMTDDDDDIPAWGDMYKLPWCVLLHEQIVAAQAIADALNEQGFMLAEGYKVGAGEDDNFFQSAHSFEAMARQELAALPEAQQADFAAVCFEDPQKQQWLRVR